MQFALLTKVGEILVSIIRNFKNVSSFYFFLIYMFLILPLQWPWKKHPMLLSILKKEKIRKGAYLTSRLEFQQTPPIMCFSLSLPLGYNRVKSKLQKILHYFEKVCNYFSTFSFVFFWLTFLPHFTAHIYTWYHNILFQPHNLRKKKGYLEYLPFGENFQENKKISFIPVSI